MNKVEQHMEICKQLNEIYKKKNEAYGDSFSRLYYTYGFIYAMMHIEEKVERLKALIKGADDNGESVTDSLKDLANYCTLTLMEIENKGEKNNA